MLGVIYCRVSGEDQSSYGLSSQEQHCRELAQQVGYNVLQAFLDDGYSSERLDRPGLEKLRDLVRAQAINAVIAHSPDRLSRRAGHMYLLEEEFRRHNVRLLYVTSTANDDTPEGRLTGHIRAAISEFEIESIRERIRRGKRARALEGLPQLGYGIPYGYQYVHNSLVIDPSESLIVQEIFRLRIQGMGSYRIAKLLTLRGVPTKRGHAQWHPSTITYMLRSTIYVGQAFHNKTTYRERTDGRSNAKRPKSVRTPNAREDWLPVQCPAIITREVFDAAQVVIDHHKEVNPRRSKHFYLLAHGRLRCICGRAMGGFLDRKGRFYRCSRKEHPRCGKMVSCDWIEEQAWNVVKILIESDPFYLQQELQRRAENQPLRYRTTDLDAVADRLREVDTKRQRWKAAYASGVIDLSEFSDLRKALDAEERTLQTLRQEIETELARVHQRDIDVGHVLQLLEKVRGALDNYGPEERQKVLQALGLTIIFESRESWKATFHLPTDWNLDPDATFRDILPLTIR